MKQITNRKSGRWSLAIAAMSLLSLPLGVAAADEIPCNGGFLIGQRCVLWEHLEHIPASPQPTDPGNLVYDFDKTYENMGEILTDEPMIEADADLGGFYMYNGNYVRLGVSYPSFVATSDDVVESQKVPYRNDPRNDKLPYNLNAVKAHDGNDLAAPNCTVCHSSVFQGKLVEGLGRNNHFVGTEASGFTLNILGIAVNSIFKGDTFIQLKHGITLLVRLFRDAALTSHLFDVFAGLGMRHDPDTLEWTGRLNGYDPDSNMKGWIDFPAWWLMKKKNALYQAGTGRGAKADHLLYMSWFSVDGIEEAENIQNNFAHLQKWIEEDVKAPKFEDFGGTIDYDLADSGKLVFLRTCAVCHGTYSENEEEETFPNFLVDLEEIGTDPYLATNNWIYPVKTWYDESWYGKRGTSTIAETNGYLAPPLDGVFITAPYFHNGSVPTLEAVLDSSKRPSSWTVNTGDDASGDNYDWEAVGWKIKTGGKLRYQLNPYTAVGLGTGRYDTGKRGNSNQGHTYGDELTEQERREVLEYLKTL